MQFTAAEYFHKAVICKVIYECYEGLQLPANAEFFRQRAIYYIAKGLEALAFQCQSTSRVEQLET